MQRNSALHNIIAINPGSRYLAIAVFEGAKLREWRLKSIQGEGAQRKLAKARDILTTFIERYRPDILAMKKLHPARSSATLKKMAAVITEYCEKQGINVSCYSIQDLKSTLTGSVKINRKEICKILAAEYPELCNELKREQRSRNPYFVRLFEAVALGHVCLHKIDNNH